MFDCVAVSFQIKCLFLKKNMITRLEGLSSLKHLEASDWWSSPPARFPYHNVFVVMLRDVMLSLIPYK